MNDSKKALKDDSGRDSRRRFLRDAALVAALPALDGLVSRESAAASAQDCLDPKAPMANVEGKVAFITGGASGIGLGIARAFTDAGMKVVLANRSEKHFDEAMEELKGARERVHAIQVDVTDRAAVEKAAAETVNVFGKVHVLVNNAAVNLYSTLSTTTFNNWDWLMNVNLNGVFNGVRIFLPHIQAHGEGGQVISTSSVVGLYANRGGAGAAYSVSKFAVVGLMESLRAELAGSNIGASVYCPGFVKSNLSETSLSTMPDQPANAGFKKADPQTLEKIRRFEQDMMDPLEAGRLVLRGMRNNDLYILTHPEFEQIVQDRYEALRGSFPRDVQVSDARISAARLINDNPIYAIERARKRCWPTG